MLSLLKETSLPDDINRTIFDMMNDMYLEYKIEHYPPIIPTFLITIIPCSKEIWNTLNATYLI